MSLTRCFSDPGQSTAPEIKHRMHEPNGGGWVGSNDFLRRRLVLSSLPDVCDGESEDRVCDWDACRGDAKQIDRGWSLIYCRAEVLARFVCCRLISEMLR